MATGARKDISRKKFKKKEAQWKKGALKSCFASRGQWPPEDVRAFTTHPTELLSDCVTEERPSISQHKLRREAIVSTTMYVSLFSLRGALNQTCHPLLPPPPPAKKEMCSTLPTAETTISYSAGEGEIKT